MKRLEEDPWGKRDALAQNEIGAKSRNLGMMAVVGAGRGLLAVMHERLILMLFAVRYRFEFGRSTP